jgi:8-oxo-dGTP pyrophosphatase MutT (NUDIX family)
VNIPVPRSAATVLVVRDVASNQGPAIEVLLVRRRSTAVFAAGANVFPGGAVDLADGAPAMASLTVGHDDRSASGVLQIASGGLGFYVAAIRECFEEAGLLFAEDSSGLVSFTDAVTRARFEQHRRQLNTRVTTFEAVCRAERLQLAAGRLRYFSHWITPPGETRRFDTRFFVGVAPEGQDALHDDAEVVASAWINPGEALDRHQAGELDLMFPTIKHLQALARFSSAEEVLSSVPSRVPVRPRVSPEGEAGGFLLPGDPGYDDAGLPADTPSVVDPLGVERG